ncbi:MAG: hypothetical protein K2J67_00065 [Lachnospiraceae bacterium]|nr:hypothetical protein [Lachnospiraceae bacterium]
MQQSKEEQMAFKHFLNLCRMAYQRGIPLYSDFIGLAHRDFVYQAAAEQFPSLSTQNEPVVFYGGYPDAERNVVCFLPEPDYPKPPADAYPICCIQIKPVNRRFSENLTHRDYLGTIMGLGLERDQIGDIVIKQEGNEFDKTAAAYVFCKQNKAELLLNVNRIRHTTVSATKTDAQSLRWTPEYKEITGSVSSLRMDAVLSIAIRTSRTQGLQLIREGQVYLNGRCCTENAKLLQNGDIFVVRGYGKYLFCDTGGVSKKGRYQIIVKQYI